MFFNRSSSSQTLAPAEANARADLQIIDVRSRQEWKSGHVARAKHIPLDELPNRLGEINQSKPVGFICQSGARSKRAAKLATDAGLEAINISGGMSAWQRAGLASSTR
jgi:rhodanese-related sulfurtransferase